MNDELNNSNKSSAAMSLMVLALASCMALIICPVCVQWMDGHIPVFESLGGELPAITVWVLNYGAVMGYGVAPVLCIAAWIGYAVCEDKTLVQIMAIVVLIVSSLIALWIYLGVYLPMQELQRSLS